MIYNQYGKETEYDNEGYAKMENGRLYVKLQNHRIHHPKDTEYKRILKWERVSDTVFSLYLRFLQTGNDRFLTQADRALVQ